MEIICKLQTFEDNTTSQKYIKNLNEYFKHFGPPKIKETDFGHNVRVATEDMNLNPPPP